MPFRESPGQVLRRQARLHARLDAIRPQLTALRELEAEAREIERALAADRAVVERRLSLPLLDNLEVASPCDERWDAMEGDERIRHCRRCDKNVYDLSTLTREQAERLVFEREGAVCVRFYRRSDGTILTADCPPARRRVRRLRGALATLLAAILGVFALRGFGSPADAKPRSIGTRRPGDGMGGVPGRGQYLGMGRRTGSGSHFTGFEILDGK